MHLKAKQIKVCREINELSFFSYRNTIPSFTERPSTAASASVCFIHPDLPAIIFLAIQAFDHFAGS
jgi:hypothetical protein